MSMSDDLAAQLSAQLTRAMDAHRNGQTELAIRLYRQLLAVVPDHAGVLRLLALAEGTESRLPYGIDCLDRSHRASPNQPQMPGSAVRLMHAIIQQSPAAREEQVPATASPDACIRECIMLVRLRELAPANPDLDALRTHLIREWQRMAFTLFSTGDLATAEQMIVPLLHIRPDDISLLNLYAVIRRRRGYPDDAVAVLQRAHAINPRDVTILTNLASVLLQQDDVTAAVNCYSTLTSLALSEYNAFHLDEAENACRTVLNLLPQTRNAHIVLGLTLMRLDRLDEAAATLSEATRLDPGFALGFSYKGDALREAGRMAEAETAYRQAAALDPTLAEAIGGIGLIRYAAGEHEQAQPLLERSQRLKSHISAVSSALSCLLLVRSAPPNTRFPRRRAADKPALSISSLSRFGRLAHTVYDYITVRLYAEKHGLELETPTWAGGMFFDLDDPLMGAPRRNILRHHAGFRERFRKGLLGEEAEPVQDVDVFLGWTLVELPEIAAHRQTVQRWMQPRSLWMPRLRPALDRLEAAGETIVAVHIRRTDRSCEGALNFDAYRAWLGRMWDSLPRPVLLVATDDPSVLPEFAPFAPHTLHSLVEPWHRLEHLQDFYLLMNADVVALSVGGFARVAAALGTRAKLVVEPDPATGDFRPVNLWGP